MSVKNVRAEDFAAVLKQDEEARKKAIIRGVHLAIEASAEVIRNAAPEDLGNLKKSVRPVIQGDGGYVVVDAPYAAAVELGSRPHWVPFAALLPWCIRHSSPEEGPRFARALQLKIAREGTKPTYFVRKTEPQRRRLLKAAVEQELKGVG